MGERSHRVWRITRISVVLSLVLFAMWRVMLSMVPEEDIAEADPRIFEIPGAVVERIGPAPETGAAARTYRDLIARGPYFAAIAMNPEGGIGWADNHVTMATAEAFAIAWCAEEGEECQVILRISPEREIAWEGQPLSRSAADAMQEYLKQPAPKAFAMTEMGGWGVSWGHPDRATAERVAMGYCAAREVTKASGLERRAPCRLIWSE